MLIPSYLVSYLLGVVIMGVNGIVPTSVVQPTWCNVLGVMLVYLGEGGGGGGGELQFKHPRWEIF